MLAALADIAAGALGHAVGVALAAAGRVALLAAACVIIFGLAGWIGELAE